MASTSAPRQESSGARRRLGTSANTLCSDYQSLIIEIRKSITLIKSIAVDLEKEHQTDIVKQLEDSVLELLGTCNDCTCYSSAIQAVADGYQPQGEKLTKFNALLESEFAKFKKESVLLPQSDPVYRQFKETVWNVHHAGQPMPGEEQEDIVMTNTQGNLLNTKCPLTLVHIFDLKTPVRCKDCKHIYEKDAVMHYINTKKPHPQCPVAGCPKILKASSVVCDPMLPIEIDEARSKGDEAGDSELVEDFGEDDEN